VILIEIERQRGRRPLAKKMAGAVSVSTQYISTTILRKPSAFTYFTRGNPDLNKSNALISWTWELGHGRNLGIENAWLLVSKRFYFR
jgi:hypothetical protein